MRCDALLYYTILCYAILYYAVLYYIRQDLGTHSPAGAPGVPHPLYHNSTVLYMGAPGGPEGPELCLGTHSPTFKELYGILQHKILLENYDISTCPPIQLSVQVCFVL